MKSATDTVSLAQLRAYVVSHQRFATRFVRAGADEVDAAIDRLSCVQLDSISTVERSHRLVLTSRVGAYPPGTVSSLLGEGRIFEYWAHEACLLPIRDYPLFRRAAAERDGEHPWWGPIIAAEPKLAEEVLGAIRERGPLRSRDFEGDAGEGPWGGMWNLKPAKRMLEALHTAGQLVIAGRESFQRVYDLPERVLPSEALAAPIPSEAEYLRSLIGRAVRARGALTLSGVREHYRLRGGVARLRAHADALVAAGELRQIEVDDGDAPLLVPGEAQLDGDAPRGAVLLSPFENLLWDRPFAKRLFGFEHLIEVYKPAPQRAFGYYVLPLLVGDRLVGRADLKSDRAAGVLRVQAFHPEPGVRRSLDAPLASAAGRLARVLGLEGVER